MIVIDAQRVLELKGQIQALDQAIAALVGHSEIARRIDTIPGFGNTCSGELAGEIGTLERFARRGQSGGVPGYGHAGQQVWRCRRVPNRHDRSTRGPRPR